MRLGLLENAPTLAAFMFMLLIAGSLGMALRNPGYQTIDGDTIWPLSPILFDGPDTDKDGYPDAVDIRTGDLMIAIELRDLTFQQKTKPYILVGTHDDQWRLGRELQWRHIIDTDPLDYEPGSKAWQEVSIRKGTWQINEPGSDYGQALGEGLAFTNPGTFFINVRDDELHPTIWVEVWHQARSKDQLQARIPLLLDIDNRTVSAGITAPLGQAFSWQSEDVGLELNVTLESDLFLATKQEIAARNAPIMLFDEGEEFTPTNAQVLEKFHGFKRPPEDLRTWSRSFNNGRDSYQFLLADFNGDRRTNHQDATIMWDILSATSAGAPTIYSHVTRIQDDQIAVQYWFIYQYNFVLNDDGDDLDILAHAGDREFIQLIFSDVQDALTGRPDWIAYSQHYGGLRIQNPQIGQAPYHLNDTHPAVYPARGSHASYPIPGDDSPTRRVFVGYSDAFDGKGEVWGTEDYDLQILGDQSWFLGYKWGPTTRYSRDMGTSSKPLLVHDLRYPFHDPLDWLRMLPIVQADDLDQLYAEAT